MHFPNRKKGSVNTLKDKRKGSEETKFFDSLKVGSVMKATLSKKEIVLALGHCDTYFPGPHKITIAKIFAENQGVYINSIILCEQHTLGHSLYECPHCQNFTFVWHTCKSCFCNRCGVRYARQLSDSIASKLFDCPHRHSVFTVPDPLRSYFLKDRSLLHELFGAVEDTLHYVIRKAGTKQDELIPCAVLTLHTFGRPLHWIPHITMILCGFPFKNSYSIGWLRSWIPLNLRK